MKVIKDKNLIYKKHFKRGQNGFFSNNGSPKLFHSSLNYYYYSPNPMMNNDLNNQIKNLKFSIRLKSVSTPSISLSWENINVYSKSQSKFCFLRNRNKENSEITTKISETVSIDNDIKRDQILSNG
jgi:hypothetical protein